MIVCCGEALIDMVLVENAYQPISGGAIFNTAVALGRLGVRTGFCGGLSTDFLGEQLCQSLTMSNVDYRYSYRVDAPTTLSFVRLFEGQASYLFYDENSAGRFFQSSNITPIPAQVSAFHFGGISLIQSPCAEAFEKLISTAKKCCVLSFDPNIRPDFIRDTTGYRRRINRLLSVSDIIKISSEDLQWLAPSQTIQIFAQRCLEDGASVVLFTEGSKGARAFTKDLALWVEGKQVVVKDTIGAGDSFNAGFLSSLDEQSLLSKPQLKNISEKQLLHALNRANRVAAFTVTQRGAEPPWKRDIACAGLGDNAK